MKRGLSRDEAALWARVAGTVKPIAGKVHPAIPSGERQGAPIARVARRLPPASSIASHVPPKAALDLRSRPLTLDANWDRKLAQGQIAPDFTLDLHGYSLDAAHTRLDQGLALALAQGARLVLLITGKPRASDGQGGRGERRGAIRAKFLDWLAHGSHSSRIAAIRPAHPRHGGAGAVYLVLRKQR